MEEPAPFEIENDPAVFRPKGHVSLERAVREVTEAITFARERRKRKRWLGSPTIPTSDFWPPQISSQRDARSEVN